MQAQFDHAVQRVSGYQGAEPIFVHIDDWKSSHVGTFTAFCTAQGLTVKEGVARGKKTLRVTRNPVKEG